MRTYAEMQIRDSEGTTILMLYAVYIEAQLGQWMNF